MTLDLLKKGRRRVTKTLGLAAVASLVLAGCSNGATATSTPETGKGLPSGTLSLVTPYGAGGTTDVAARALAAGLEADLDNTVIVENKPGASGIVGTTEVSRAKPNGSTVLFAVDNVFTQSAVRPTSYNFDSFTGIKGFFGQAYIIVVGKDSAYKTVKDLKNSGTIKYATSGWANEQHLNNVMLFEQLGVNATAIPFDGNAPATQALVGGNVDVSMGDAQALMPFIKSGDIRAIAVLSPDAKRLEYLPEVPTLEEAGIKTSGLLLPQWGFAVPAGTPQSVVDTWSKAITAASQKPEFQKFAKDNYFIMIPEQSAASWYGDARTSAQAYAGLLKQYNIQIK